MDFEDRLKYYLGNLYNIFITNQQIEYKDIFNEKETISYNKIQLINNDILFHDNYDNQIRYYVNDLRKYFNNSEIKNFNIYIAFGDINVKMKKYCFTKSRPIDLINNFNILLNLNTPRHWEGLDDVNNFDIPFDKKNNKIIWRGKTTGNKRVNFVEKYQNHQNQHIDIKFSNLCQNVIDNNYILSILSIKEQLQSKFLISIEGNDVATNLKWILYSNSVVIMPKPTVCSWIMEDKLISGLHYIEIKSDYSDLEEKYKWCLNNLEKCKKVAEAGKKYIEQFLNQENEKKITNKIIEIYCKTIKIKYN
jgi:hypothetical protein